MTARAILIRAAKLSVPPVVSFFVGRAIYRNWEQVRAADWTLDPLLIAASFILCSGWFLFRPLGWNIIINRFGRRVPYPAVFRVYRKSELSRYVPGAIWQFVSRVYFIKEWGVAPAACLAATMVDLFLAVLACMVPAFWTLNTLLPELGQYHRVAIIVFPILAIAVVHPKILNFWAGFIAKKLRQPYPELRIRWSALAGIWGMYLVGWFALCGGIAIFVKGLIEVPWEPMPFVASSYAVAWLAGTLAMIAPAGMGIRDYALGLLLSQVVGEGPGFTLAVAIRLWVAMTEVVWAVIGEMAFPRSDPPGGNSEHPA